MVRSHPQAEALRRRHHGISRVGTVTATTSVVAAGLTVAVAGGLAVTHASASPTSNGAVPDSRDAGVAGDGSGRGDRFGDPSSGDGGLAPAQSPPQVQSHGS